nr:TATA-box-binding protein-like isoform X2 [Ciona intestinalis]|eukprot:XP_026691097.1 TATA-box-binding protein-like isoform X2 [Ciona intestinalis]
MDDFGGTFFDLSASAHNSTLSNPISNMSSSSLCGGGNNFFLQEQTSDLDTLLMSDTGLNMDNPFSNGITSNGIKSIKSEPLFSNVNELHSSSIQGMPQPTRQDLFPNSSFSSIDSSSMHTSLEYMLDNPVSVSLESKPIKTEPSSNQSYPTKVKLVSVGGFTGPANILSKVSIIRPGQSIQKLTGQEVISPKVPPALPQGMQAKVLATCPKVTQAEPLYHHAVKTERPDDIVPVVKEEPLMYSNFDLQDGSKLNISVCNVVSSFRVHCHLNLRQIALEGMDVVYRRETQKVVMRMRNPKCTAYMWSSGKIVCTGSSSAQYARQSAKRFARRLLKIGFKVKFAEFRVVNVLAVCKMPYAIDINEFAKANRGRHCSYEPELHPGVTFRESTTKATLKIFSTGSVTVTARSVEKAKNAIRTVYPMFQEFYRFEKPNLDFDISDVLPSDTEDCS